MHIKYARLFVVLLIFMLGGLKTSGSPYRHQGWKREGESVFLPSTFLMHASFFSVRCVHSGCKVAPLRYDVGPNHARDDTSENRIDLALIVLRLLSWFWMLLVFTVYGVYMIEILISQKSPSSNLPSLIHFIRHRASPCQRD